MLGRPPIRHRHSCPSSRTIRRCVGSRTAGWSEGKGLKGQSNHSAEVVSFRHASTHVVDDLLVVHPVLSWSGDACRLRNDWSRRARYERCGRQPRRGRLGRVGCCPECVAEYCHGFSIEVVMGCEIDSCRYDSDARYILVVRTQLHAVISLAPMPVERRPPPPASATRPPPDDSGGDRPTRDRVVGRLVVLGSETSGRISTRRAAGLTTLATTTTLEPRG